MFHALVLCAALLAPLNANGIVDVDGDDPAMNAAIAKARKSTADFLKALKSPKKNQKSFAVKWMFQDGDKKEHMWISDVSYDGKVFKGTLNNDPRDVKNVKIGDKVEVDPAKISDWMYVEDDKLIGGFTIRVLRDKLSPRERKKFDRDIPFKIE